MIEKRAVVADLDYFRNLITFSDGEGMIKAMLLAVSASASYLFPTVALQDTAVAAAILIAVDTVSGVTAAFVEKRRRSSQAFRRIITKAFAYLSVCAVAAVVEKTILKGSGLSVSMGVLWLIIATEGVSVIENVERVSGGRFRLLRAILGKVIDEDKIAASKEKDPNV